MLKLHVLMGGGFEADRTDTKTDGGEDQVTFYYNGIGTREEGRSIPLLGSLRNALNMAVAPRWGNAARIFQEARREFEGTDYEEGDRIVVFGFSRGAALARKFASRILGEGLCGEVAFLGVFDTVAAMDGIHRKGEKISTDVVFENGTLHSGVRRAVHAVSLDETRVKQTAVVGGYGPNRFGLHDMHGNVQEWVEDCWNGSYEAAPIDGSAWRSGVCVQRVMPRSHDRKRVRAASTQNRAGPPRDRPF